MRIGIATDHNGVEEKKAIITFLKENNIEVIDYSTDNTPTDDYPDFAKRVADNIVAKNIDLGILMCGTGIGMSIAANKIKGIRAALCNDIFTSKLSRQHNDSNVLVLGSRVIGFGVATEIVKNFINCDFEGGRHASRLELIKRIEQKN